VEFRTEMMAGEEYNRFGYRRPALDDMAVDVGEPNDPQFSKTR
jgi:hypothetical protein